MLFLCSNLSTNVYRCLCVCVLRRSEDVFFPFTAFSVSTYFAFSLLPLPFLFPPFVSRGFRAGFGVNQLQIYGEKRPFRGLMGRVWHRWVWFVPTGSGWEGWQGRECHSALEENPRDFWSVDMLPLGSLLCAPSSPHRLGPIFYVFLVV